MELLTIIPPWLPLLLSAALLLVLPRRAGFGLASLAVLALIPLSLFAPDGNHLQWQFLGFESTFLLIDDFTRLLGLGFGILGTAAIWYALAAGMARKTAAFALAYIACTIGVVFAGDWLSLLFFWELMAVTSTLLVWSYGGKAVRAGYRYAIAHGIGGSLVLLAVAWHFAVVGTFAFDHGSAGIATGGPAFVAIIGIGVNCGFIGLHTWLPDTYPRPHPAASVFLSVFTTKTSAYVLYRALPLEWELLGTIDIGILVAYMGGLMAVYGVIFALLQHDMRALLSYHIQAQVGYMVAAIGIWATLQSDIAVAGAMAHVFNNIMYKALLFMAVGVIILRTREHDLYRLGGLWREMPLTAIAFAIGAISITAVPGTNGFISKGMILDAADPGYYGSPEFQILWILLMIGAIGTFLSFIKLGYYAFLHGPATQPVADASTLQTIGMLVIAGVCLGFGVWWETFASILPQGTMLVEQGEITPYSMGHLLDATVLLVVSVIGFAVIRKPLSKIGHVHDVDRWLNPAVFYAGRYAMLGITETFAAIDRTVVRVVVTAYWIGNHPVTTVQRVGLIEIDGTGQSASGYYHRSNTVHLRASIGITVLLVALLVALAIILVV